MIFFRKGQRGVDKKLGDQVTTWSVDWLLVIYLVMGYEWWMDIIGASVPNILGIWDVYEFIIIYPHPWGEYLSTNWYTGQFMLGFDFLAGKTHWIPKIQIDSGDNGFPLPNLRHIVFKRKERQCHHVRLRGPHQRQRLPGLQGGPHNQSITALAVALRQANSPEFKTYIEQVIKILVSIVSICLCQLISMYI